MHHRVDSLYEKHKSRRDSKISQVSLRNSEASDTGQRRSNPRGCSTPTLPTVLLENNYAMMCFFSLLPCHNCLAVKLLIKTVLKSKELSELG